MPTMFSAELRLPPVQSRRRAGARTDVSAPASFAIEDVSRALCRIGDLSAGGARLELFDEIAPRSEIELCLPGGLVRRARIAWVRGFECGCSFDEPLDDETMEALAAAFGVTPDADSMLLAPGRA